MKKILILTIVILITFTLFGSSSEDVEPIKYELISVATDSVESSSASGFLVWFSYNDENKPIYNFYIKDEDGAIYLKYTSVYRVAIYEDLKDEELPYATITDIQYAGSTYGVKFHVKPNSIQRYVDVDYNK